MVLARDDGLGGRPGMKVEKYIEDMKTHNLHINDNDSDTTNLHVHVIPG